MFKGSIVAIVTPMKDGKVDEAKLRELVEFQIEKGTDGIVPCGTTGESATLTYEEHCQVIDLVIDQVKGRVPVIAGTGSNSTHETIFLTKHAKEAGADAALVITPYYNKPTQKGLYEHFKAVAEAVDIPIILYNVPGRTAVNMLPETVIELSKIKNIVGVKEASGSLDQAAEIIAGTDDSFALLSGEDSLTYPLLCLGAKGVISVATNIVPELMAELVDSFFAGDINKAKELHYKLFPLFKAIFFETNPIPVKKALYLMGLIEDEIRLPLVPMTEANTERLRKVLLDLGLSLKN
ncbi:dihydrodipicolinate synthase [Deferribacter desulfuricans SSM1]|uniref:4-hydroxy-tetrahydrodipicolinate synthase n=1 Tax=Deferribacter desulfuricans (strain DSM 14783 / JCM 11476 / NBRC 101012 / SSM1) TaxID=639282 RepID=D3PAV3_DEFDS|nr:4-hydroxy-tetrahydrodipicolinate synthase [Deferribacter desulfuricans]BAI79726.1 dihydrodipicolinate synthase [Deferribacter desulfuricans SSM1]